LLALLRDVPPEKRTAAFYCCIVAASADGRTFAFEGRCPGRILTAPRGHGGFGYDPLFRPDGFEPSYAELGADVKHRISHRARALAQFVAWLRPGGAAG
jgi:XTP/dITP diphosphohydrolase